MPPELILALAAALIAAYLVSDVVARLVNSILRGILVDHVGESRFIDRPRRIVRALVFVVTAAALCLPALTVAGYRTRFGLNPDSLIVWLLDAGLRIVVIAIAAYFVIRIGSAAARRFEREMSTGTGLDVIERTKRAKTLSRLLHKALTSVVIAIAGLMILREFRIDITPVLTGAGIVGLAIGFGAQTLVRDVISGFFLIVEDQVRVGDVAAINGQGGLVEAVNLRTIVLRDEEGAVHVFPNGEVKTLVNRSKDFSYFVLSVAIPSDADPSAVEAAMQDAGASLIADDAFKPHILAPIEIFGVDAFEPGQILVKARIKTVPLKQWLVGRELRRRIARLFAERKIESPTPRMHVTLEHATGNPEAGKAEGVKST